MRQFTLRNCRFASNGQHLLKIKKLFKTAHATVNFAKMGLLDQKRADILKFAIFVQNSVHNNEMLESGVFCVKRRQNNNLTKYSHSFT